MFVDERECLLTVTAVVALEAVQQQVAETLELGNVHAERQGSGTGGTLVGCIRLSGMVDVDAAQTA